MEPASDFLAGLSNEQRVDLAVGAWRDGKYKTVAAAARAYGASYYATVSRSKGAKPRSQNGGAKLLTEEEELALFAWDVRSRTRRSFTRRVRWGHYLEARNEAIQAEALRLGRPEKDIVLPLYWAPPGDRPKPITPWIYNLPTQHIVEEVISAFVTGKEPPIKPEEDEGEDEIPILEEEEEDQSRGPTWEEHIEMLRKNDTDTYHYGPGHGWILPSSDPVEQDSGIQLDSIMEEGEEDSNGGVNTMPKSGDVEIDDIPDENIDPVLLNN